MCKVVLFLLWETLEFWVGIFWGFVVSYWCFVHMGSFGFAELPVVYRTWVLSVCTLAGHALWAEVGFGITFVTSGENA